jgi:hypothetical protein
MQICSGDIPRQMSSRIVKAIRSKSSSRALMPRLASESVESASAWAKMAEYSQRCFLPHERGKVKQPLHTHGQRRRCSQRLCCSGMEPARMPLQSLCAQVLLRCTSSVTVEGERSMDAAISRHPFLARSPASIARLSALVSLSYRFAAMLFIDLLSSMGPLPDRCGLHTQPYAFG